MYQLNLLLVFSNAIDRKRLTSFLNENSFVIRGVVHAIDDVKSLPFYPDIAIIQHGPHSVLDIDKKLTATYPSVKTIIETCGSLNYLPGYVLNQDEILDILQREHLQKAKNLIASIQQSMTILTPLKI